MVITLYMRMSRKIKSFVMDLWISWWNIVCLLRPAFSRARTFLWFLLVLAAFSVRNDLLGVSSFVRALGLSEHFYEHLLHFFHSNAVKTDRLAELWFAIVIKHFPVYKIGCRPVLVLDGIKKSKEGRKMPAVKYLHQQSESNSKPHFIMSHSFQAFGVLCQVGGYFFCVPVCARIHEGIVTSNRDRRTLIDKANEMLASVCRGQEFVLLADAYYANGKVIRSTKGRSGVLVTRVRRTTTGFRPAAVPRKRKRGRPKKYGAAVKLQNVFGTGGFSSVPSPVYGEETSLSGSSRWICCGSPPGRWSASFSSIIPREGGSSSCLPTSPWKLRRSSCSTVCVSRSKSLSSKRCIRSAHSDTISGWPLCDRSQASQW